MKARKIVVLGSNFGGATAAMELQRKLKSDAHVTVISPNPNFTYIPSLIWVPFGQRKLNDISFPIRPMLEKKGIEFIQDNAIKASPESNEVHTEKNGTISYDYLVISTGIQMDFNIVENLNPEKRIYRKHRHSEIWGTCL